MKYIRWYLYMLDSAILTKTESIADKIQEWVGVTSKYIARLLLCVYIALRILYIVLKFCEYHSLLLGICDFIIFAVFVGVFSVMLLFKEKEEDMSDLQKVVMERIMQYVRTWLLNYYHWVLLFWLLGSQSTFSSDESVSLTKLITKLDFADDIIKILFVYFVSVVPLPPKKSRIKEIFEKIADLLSPAPQFAFTPKAPKGLFLFYCYLLSIPVTLSGYHLI